MKSPFQTAISIGKSALLALVIMITLAIIVFTVFLYFAYIPKKELLLTSVAVDTTFSIGRNESKGRSGGQLAVRAVGEVDDSTAVILVKYPDHPLVALQCCLPKGKIDKVWSGDFYDSKAEIAFLHKGVKHGRLHLQIVFSSPPPNWGYKWKNGHWMKANKPSSPKRQLNIKS